MLGSGFKFDKPINSVVKPNFPQLHLLAKIEPFLSSANLEKAIYAFMSSRLDH